jgi:DNA polymerase-3 subunit delta
MSEVHAMLCPMDAHRSGRSGTNPAAAASGTGASSPAALTLLVGSERFLLNRATRRVLASARALDPSVERRDVDAVDPGAVGALQSALSPSLFGESAVVVVAGLADAPDSVAEALAAGLSDPADSTWVVVEHAGTRSKRTLDQLRRIPVRGGVAEVACAEVKRGRPTRELLEGEARAAGRRLSNDGADALVMAVGSDIALLVGALEQLMADNPEDPIDAAVVSATFAGVAEVSGFQLADAVWEGRALQAMHRLRWGLDSQTMSGVGAVGSLASGLRAMVRVAGAPRGMAEGEVARLAGVPPFKVRALRSAVHGWEPSQLADAAVALAAVDARAKGGLRPGESLEPAQKVHALEAFIMATTGLGEHRPASASASVARRGGPASG